MSNPDNNSFTRSIYIGKDKSAEVLKRKEEAEKELMARREAKVREQEERLVRAKQQKETEMRERIRQRQQKELERQKAVLDRRYAQLEKMNVKKEEILHRNHQKTSRIAAGQQKKPVYVFGSSTPRELSYLEKLNQQQRSARNASISRGTSPSVVTQELKNEPGTSNGRAPSRFLISGGRIAPPPSAMTNSVFGSLSNGTANSSAAGSSHSRTQAKKQPIVAKTKPSPVKKQPQNLTLTNGSVMTQSLYTPKPRNVIVANPRSAVKSAARPAAAKGLPKQTPTSNNNNASFEPNKPKPVIRPRKAQQQQQSTTPENAEMSTSTMHAQSRTTTEVIMDNVKQEMMETEVPVLEQPLLNEGLTLAMEMEEHQQQHVQQQIADIREDVQPVEEVTIKQETLESGPEIDNIDTEPMQQDPLLTNGTQLLGELVEVRALLQKAMEGMGTTESRDNTGQENGQSGSTSQLIYDIGVDSTHHQEMIHEQQEGHVSNRPSLLDSTAETLVAKEEQNDSYGSKSDGSEDVTMIEVIQEPEANKSQASNSPQNGEEKTTTASALPPKSTILPLEQEETRESRRQRLNAILQRTRQDNAAMGTAGSNEAGNVINPVMVSSATNPLLNNIDPAALAKEVLAQRRQQKLLQQQQQNASEGVDENQHHRQRPMALANELAESGGYFGNGRQMVENPIPQYYQLPGQTITPQQEHASFISSRTVLSAYAGDHQRGNDGTNGNSSALRTPPEDPHMEEQEREKESHPPEPTALIDFS